MLKTGGQKLTYLMTGWLGWIGPDCKLKLFTVTASYQKSQNVTKLFNSHKFFLRFFSFKFPLYLITNPCIKIKSAGTNLYQLLSQLVLHLSQRSCLLNTVIFQPNSFEKKHLTQRQRGHTFICSISWPNLIGSDLLCFDVIREQVSVSLALVPLTGKKQF
jgi:hypothetical protein